MISIEKLPKPAYEVVKNKFLGRQQYHQLILTCNNEKDGKNYQNLCANYHMHNQSQIFSKNSNYIEYYYTFPLSNSEQNKYPRVKEVDLYGLQVINVKKISKNITQFICKIDYYEVHLIPTMEYINILDAKNRDFLQFRYNQALERINSL